MAGHTKWSEISRVNKEDRDVRARVGRHKNAMKLALALTELRESRNLTQEEVANRMGKAQPNVSRLERRVAESKDIYFSSLGAYVAALGGHLEVHAVFPDGEVVVYDDGREEVTPAIRGD